MTITGANVGANATLEFAVSCPNAVLTDAVVASPTTALPAGLALSHARVSAANVVSIGIANLTGIAVASTNLVFEVRRISNV